MQYTYSKLFKKKKTQTIIYKTNTISCDIANMFPIAVFNLNLKLLLIRTVHLI